MRELRTYKKSYENNGRSGILVQEFMGKVYRWMSMGLCATGVVSYFAVRFEPLMILLFGQGMMPIIVLCVVEVGLVLYLSKNIMELDSGRASMLFFVYAALNGLTLAPIFLVYTSESITSTFFVTAGMFGAMSLYGTVTKSDLSGWRDFLYMGLIGIIIASLVNIFLKSEMVMWVTTYIGIFVFLGLTAYDTQRLRAIAQDNSINENNKNSLSIYGALILYLDFLNLFLKLLRVMGKRK